MPIAEKLVTSAVALSETAVIEEAAETVTLGEKLLEGGQTLILGLGTVFAVLILLILVIKLMTALLNWKKAEKPATPAPAPVVVAPAPVAQPAQEDQAVIAAIAAAVALMGEAENTRLVVRSVRRIGQNAPAWSRVTR